MSTAALEMESEKAISTTQWKHFHTSWWKKKLYIPNDDCNVQKHTYRYEDVEKVLQRGKLRNELLHYFTESLKDGMIIDACQVETVEGREELSFFL